MVRTELQNWLTLLQIHGLKLAPLMIFDNDISVQIQTTNATPTILWNLNVNQDNLYVIKSIIYGWTNGFTETIVAEFSAVYLVEGGVITEISEDSTKKKSAGFTEVDVDFSISGSTINLVVTGLGDTVINWDTGIDVTAQNND